MDNLNIVAVEDDEFMKIFLRDVFWIHDGYHTLFNIFSDVAKAREFINKPNGKVDLIFLDLKLPEKDGVGPDTESGFRFLEELKTDPKTKNIKVIVFSGFGDKEIKDRAMKLGADKYLVKGELMPQEIIKAAWETISNSGVLNSKSQASNYK